MRDVCHWPKGWNFTGQVLRAEASTIARSQGTVREPHPPEVGSVSVTSDYVERGDINPNVRAEVAINPESEHIPVARANGIGPGRSRTGRWSYCGPVRTNYDRRLDMGKDDLKSSFEYDYQLAIYENGR